MLLYPLWDGFHGIITNDTTSKSEELLARYRRLWVIEESFRIQKHHLSIRPIYHFKPERIEAHVLLCYMAFALVRHAAYRIEVQQKKISIQDIRSELWRTQSSILHDKETGKFYRVTSKMSSEARAIYQAFGVPRHYGTREIV